MSDDLDEEDTGEEEAYEWTADGQSCPICDALDGTTFTSPPRIAHPNCNCEVHPTWRRPQAHTDCENKWENVENRSVWTGGPPANHLTIDVETEVTCWDGKTITDVIAVDFGDDPEIDVETLADELWDAVYEHVEQLVAQHCPTCAPTPVS